MPSTWIERRPTAQGKDRYRVMYRLGGRESTHRYAGSFATKREALIRKRWVAGELAAQRVPAVAQLEESIQATPTVAEAAERWRASRVDVVDGTAVGHRVQLNRVLPFLGSRRVDEITPAERGARRIAAPGRAQARDHSQRASRHWRKYSSSPASRITPRATESTSGCRGRSAGNRPRRLPTRSRLCSR